MNLKVIPAAHELISNRKSIFQLTNSNRMIGLKNCREEFLSTEHMEALGKSLALKHTLSGKSTK